METLEIEIVAESHRHVVSANDGGLGEVLHSMREAPDERPRTTRRGRTRVRR